jgi:hypothetical protein
MVGRLGMRPRITASASSVTDAEVKNVTKNEGAGPFWPRLAGGGPKAPDWVSRTAFMSSRITAAEGRRNMKIVCILIIFIAFLAVPAMSGEIWGVVRQDGILQKGLTVKILHNFDGKPSESPPCHVDQYGIYGLFVDRTGRCELKVFDDRNTEIYSATIASYKAPVRWDIHLMATAEK